VKFYQRALDYLDALKQEKEGKFVCTLPILKVGERFNVISDTCFISGSIRSFEEGLKDVIIAKLTEFLEDLVK
jgi:metal-dependent amidase/aminoacylase/carboxypeptidase family protein